MARVFDTFLMNGELDLLECRLTELDASPVYRFVIIEAAVDHKGHPKPLHYMENKERFSAWSDRIIPVVADLPDAEDPWDRERAQREAAWQGLTDADPDDTVMHGDLDEIPASAMPVTQPMGYDQRLFYYAVDWEAPFRWHGTVTAPLKSISTFCSFREQRNALPWADRGWHLSWLGGPEGIQQKLDATPHREPTFEAFARQGLASGDMYERGITWGWTGLVVDHGIQCLAVDVDESWPKWIYERKCPENWFRPRP